MSLVIATENLTPSDEIDHSNFHGSVLSSNRTIDWIPVEEYSKELTTGSVATIELDSVVGQCAGLVCIVRQTGATNTDNGLFEYVSPGDDSQIDLITAGGKSILGSGVPVDAKYLKNEVWSSHFDADFGRQKNACFIPFASDMK
jgi:hypothetical protein